MHCAYPIQFLNIKKLLRLKPLMLEVVRSDLQLQGITEPSLQEIYTRFSELVHGGDLVDATVSYHGKIMGADSPGEIRATFALPALLFVSFENCLCFHRSAV